MIHSRALASAAWGLLMLIIAMLLSELFFSSEMGHRIDFDRLPPEVHAIADENRGAPLTLSQWRRIDNIMAKRGGWPSGHELFLASVRGGWFWFLLLPMAMGWVLYKRWSNLRVLDVWLLSAPGIIFLIYAFSAQAFLLKG